MTAEVAILNTHGIALATDSAVTVSVYGEKKVYNTANKLFRLSKHHPIGIMIYNKAAYMGIDWEIIIKEYRESLKTRSFNTLFEYAKNFVEYIKKYPHITKEMQEEALFSMCHYNISIIRNFFFEESKKKFDSIENVTQKQVSQVLNFVIKNILTMQKKNTHKTNYTLDVDFLTRYKDSIYEMIEKTFEKYNVSVKQKESIFKIIVSNLKKAYYLGSYSGIVIAGYGDGEIFPSIYKCEIYYKIGKSLIFSNESRDSISYEHTAAIAPFAQEEMVHTFMSGVDPTYQRTIHKNLENLIISISDIIGDSYKSKLNQIKDEFIKYLSDFRQKVYIDPIMSIVQSLQKPDLAEMAETLVNLTAFKRHVSNDAETVGGPTDVAVITKGDGFVWIKRKQYFDIKLNKFFQQNYFKEVSDG